MQSEIDFRFIGSYLISMCEKRVEKLERQNGTTYRIAGFSFGKNYTSYSQKTTPDAAGYTMHLEGADGTSVTIYGLMDF